MRYSSLYELLRLYARTSLCMIACVFMCFAAFVEFYFELVSFSSSFRAIPNRRKFRGTAHLHSSCTFVCKQTCKLSHIHAHNNSNKDDDDDDSDNDNDNVNDDTQTH